MAKRKCVRCDLTRIYAQFDAKAAKQAAQVVQEVVVAAPAPKRPTRKKKVEEPIVEVPVEEVPEVIEEVVEETPVIEEPVIEEHEDIAE